jgi:hypothetical protein
MESVSSKEKKLKKQGMVLLAIRDDDIGLKKCASFGKMAGRITNHRQPSGRILNMMYILIQKIDP